MRELVTALHNAMARYPEYCIHEAKRELVREQCNSCYYGGGDHYCGLGMDKVPDCIYRIDGKL